MAEALRGCRVLVVEDNLLLAMSLQDILEDCGCKTVGPAPRLDRAIKLSESGPLDGAFLDINLGAETSFPLADKLAARGVPFVFLSGYSNPDAVPARFQGVPRLAKPYDSADIVRVAESLFGPCQPI